MRRNVWIAIVVASVGWGTGGPGTRKAFGEGLDPYALVSLRSLVAAGAVMVYLLVRSGNLPSSPIVWRVGLVQGIANLAVPYILFTLAYQHASAGFVGLLAALIPITTAALAHYLLADEPLHTTKLVGMALAFGGVAVLALSGDSGLAEGGNPGLAILLGSIAVVVLSLGGIYAKHHAGTYDAIELTWVQFVTGTSVIIVAMLIAEGVPRFGDITGYGWTLVVYLGFAASFMPFALFFWMLRHTSVGNASLVGYLVPIVSVIVGAIWLNEQLQPGIVVGGALILAGVLMADRAERTFVAPRP